VSPCSELFSYASGNRTASIVIEDAKRANVRDESHLLVARLRCTGTEGLVDRGNVKVAVIHEAHQGNGA
jgi:hypothetical protein